MLIHLVGPGGAGKRMIGVRLADRLNVPFIDLDACFLAQVGDISDYLRRCGYDAYANRNVEVYLSIAAAEGVIALSSGFMTYAKEVHPGYTKIRSAIAESMTAFVLLPSFDFETCVAEIVRRQVQRPLGLLASHEEAKIRQRFSIYMALPALKVETMRPPDEIVTEILGVFIARTTETGDQA
jgi:shikimate kinase